MSSNKKMITLGLFGVILAFTLLMYFGVNTSEKDSVSICAFAFVIFTEVAAFANIFFLSAKKDTFGYSVVASAYTILSLIINVLLSKIFTLRGLIIANVCLILLYAFIILIDALSKKEK